MKDNKLFLTDICNANLNFKDVFKSDKPVFADWFTGEIRVGFGKYDLYDYESNPPFGFYKNYLIVNIKEGIVTDRYITEKFHYNDIIHFGKYSGKRFNEIIYGGINDDALKTSKVLIEDLLSFLTKSTSSINYESFTFSEDELYLLNSIREKGMNYILAGNYLAVSSHIMELNYDSNAKKLSNLIEKIITGDVSELIEKSNYIKDKKKEEKCILINSDIKYILWALLNVNEFSVNPSTLDSTFEINSLKSFKINRFNDTVFSFVPFLETHDYIFPEEVKDYNKIKFLKNNKVKYRNSDFIPDLNKVELMETYGFFLDEKYIKKPKINNDFQNSNERDDIVYDTNNWLSDAAGSDDPDSMSDTWWNLD